MILTMTLFTLWFGFSSYVHREVDGGALYWVVSTINSFVLCIFLVLPIKTAGGGGLRDLSPSP